VLSEIAFSVGQRDRCQPKPESYTRAVRLISSGTSASTCGL
jgi:hypothetical protein